MIVEKWPNNLGWTVTTDRGAVRYELWAERRAVVRCKDIPDSRYGAYYGTHYLEGLDPASLPAEPGDVAGWCESLWRERRGEWKPCEE